MAGGYLGSSTERYESTCFTKKQGSHILNELKKRKFGSRNAEALIGGNVNAGVFE